jgi:hypothetical protein
MNHEHLLFLNSLAYGAGSTDSICKVGLALGRQCKILINDCGAGIVGPGLAFF